MKHFDSYEAYLKYMIEDARRETEMTREWCEALAKENAELRAALNVRY